MHPWERLRRFRHPTKGLAKVFEAALRSLRPVARVPTPDLPELLESLILKDDHAAPASLELAVHLAHLLIVLLLRALLVALGCGLETAIEARLIPLPQRDNRVRFINVVDNDCTGDGGLDAGDWG